MKQLLSKTRGGVDDLPEVDMSAINVQVAVNDVMTDTLLKIHKSPVGKAFRMQVHDTLVFDNSPGIADLLGKEGFEVSYG